MMATGPARHRLMAETYEDVERLIWDVVHKFHRKHGFQYGKPRELYSQACVGFMHAYQTYDIKKGSFSNYVRQIVEFKLLELIRTETKHRVRMHQADELEVVDPSHSSFSLGELLDEVSEDAKAIVMLVLDTPHDLLHAMQCEDNDSVKYLLRQYLVGLGWAKERIAECFSEITHALN